MSAPGRPQPDARGPLASLRAWARTASWRDLLVVILPAVLVIGGAVWVAVKSLRFAPPSTIRFITGPNGSSYRNQAEKYKKIIDRHGVKVEVRIVESSGASAASTLLARAREFRSDLVVMGAYGHSRLTELVFGGVTRTALESAELPVLMSR